MKMTSRVWTKPETQAALSALRRAGLKPKKHESGMYTVEYKGKEIFVALPGRTTYLVRHAADLFVYPAS